MSLCHVFYLRRLTGCLKCSIESLFLRPYICICIYDCEKDGDERATAFVWSAGRDDVADDEWQRSRGKEGKAWEQTMNALAAGTVGQIAAKSKLKIRVGPNVTRHVDARNLGEETSHCAATNTAGALHISTNDSCHGEDKAKVTTLACCAPRSVTKPQPRQVSQKHTTAI